MSEMKLNAEFQRYNFFRSLSWRWDRVLRVVDRYPTPGRCTRRDDDWVRKASNFLKRWRNKPDVAEDDPREDLWQEQPGLYYAYQLYTRAGEEPEGARFLEARLLARQSPEAIAKALKTHPDAVRWYEALFFNVQDALDNRDWITARVLVPAISKHFGSWKEAAGEADTALPFKDSTVARPFLDGTLKMFAYFGGQYLVDVLISGFQAGKPLASPDDLAQWFDQHISTTVRRRAGQAAMTFEVNKYNVMELMGVWTQIVALEKSEDSQDQQRTTTERHIKALVDEIPWAVGEQGEKAAAGTLLGRFDNMATELRDDEVLKVASGEPVPDIDKDWLDKLPPPRKQPSALLGHKENDL